MNENAKSPVLVSDSPDQPGAEGGSPGQSAFNNQPPATTIDNDVGAVVDNLAAMVLTN